MARTVNRLQGVALFVACWAAAFYAGIVNTILIPSPLDTASELISLLGNSEFLMDCKATLYRTAWGVTLASGIGVVIGIVLGLRPAILDRFEMLVDFLRSIPATALFPLAILLFGIGDRPKIAIVAFAGSLLMIVQVYHAVGSVSKVRFQVFQTFGASTIKTFRHLILWEIMPSLVSGLRLLVSLALILVIVSEMFIGSDAGLGSRMIAAQSSYRIEELYAVIVLVGVIGYFLNVIIKTIEKYIKLGG